MKETTVPFASRDPYGSRKGHIYKEKRERGARKEDKRRKRGKIRDVEGAVRKRTMGVKHPRQF